MNTSKARKEIELALIYLEDGAVITAQQKLLHAAALLSRSIKGVKGAIRNLILQALRDRAYRPIELLQQLQSAEVTESALKDELAELINARVIELSPERHIRLREPVSAGMEMIDGHPNGDPMNDPPGLR
jgi:hypothetical protein